MPELHGGSRTLEGTHDMLATSYLDRPIDLTKEEG